jgi:hypothetical protein
MPNKVQNVEVSDARPNGVHPVGQQKPIVANS